MSSDIEESPRSSKVEELRAEEETRREKEVNSSWAFGGGNGEREVNIDKRPSLAKTVAEVPVMDQRQKEEALSPSHWLWTVSQSHTHLKLGPCTPLIHKETWMCVILVLAPTYRNMNT